MGGDHYMENDQLGRLLQEYRTLHPDAEPGANFVPGVWQRIEARRNSSPLWFLRWAKACVVATIALALVMTLFVLPRYQQNALQLGAVQQAGLQPGNYLDVLAAADSAADAASPFYEPASLETGFETERETIE